MRTSAVIQREVELLENILNEHGNCEEILRELYSYNNKDSLQYCLFDRLMKFMLGDSKVKFANRKELNKSVVNRTVSYYQSVLNDYILISNEDISVEGVLKYIEYRQYVSYSSDIKEKLEYLYSIDLKNNPTTYEIEKQILSEILGLELEREDIDLQQVAQLNSRLKGFL